VRDLRFEYADSFTVGFVYHIDDFFRKVRQGKRMKSFPDSEKESKLLPERGYEVNEEIF